MRAGRTLLLAAIAFCTSLGCVRKSDDKAAKEKLKAYILDAVPPNPTHRLKTDFEGKVESRLHHKDIHIVLDLARTYGIELPASAAAAQVLDTLQERGGARQDSAAVITVLDSSR